MDDRHIKSGLRLSVYFIGMVVLFFAVGSYAVTLPKNTPLYKHLVKGGNSRTTTLSENKPVVSAEKVEAPLKSSDAVFAVNAKSNTAKPTSTAKPARPGRIAPASSRPTNLMDPSTFTPQMPFSEAIEILRNSTVPRLNISVLWKDLEENADIFPDTPIGIDGISGVPLSRHLKSLLDGVSGGSPQKLGYVVEDGVIVVATLDSLPQKMVTRVYDVTDLVAAPSTGMPQYGMGMMGMGMGMPGMMGGIGTPFGGGYGTQLGFGGGLGFQGGLGSPFGGGYGIQGGMMPGLGGIIGGLSPGFGTGYGNYGTGYGTSMGFSGVPYR